MASASAGPPNQILDEVNALFSWNPPLLVDSSKKSSTKTRPPGFYDKHFSPDLVLKKVERLPSLVQDLADNVDIALEAALPTLPPLSTTFPTADRRKTDRRMLSKVAKNEIAVASFYAQTTPMYCLPLASTLALHPAASLSEWYSCLLWTQSVSSSGYPIMDGELRFRQDNDVEEEARSLRAAILDTMDEDTRCIFEKMSDDQSSLATWEMKSLGAGPGEIMSAVRNLGKFAWTTCTATHCKKLPSHRKALEKVAKVVVGPDAQHPPWNLPSTADLSPLTDLSEDEDEGSRPTENKGQKRKRDYMSPPKDNARKRKRDNGDGDDDDADEEEEEEEAYQDRHDLTAQSLVQQAWAQATRVDGTFIVLYSGNHELQCVRYRASQTLYVSNVIEPHACVEPGYGKLHVGIYLAAIQDALDRKKQQQQQEALCHGGASIGGNNGQENNAGSGTAHEGGFRHGKGKADGGRGMERSGGLQSSAGSNNPTDERAVENNDNLPKSDEHKRMVQEASNGAMVLLYLQYDVYDSPVPALFFRSAPSMTFTKCPTPPISPRSIRSVRPEECLAIVLTSEIGRGATGVAHRGTLTSEISGGAKLDVVVKLGFDIEQRKALRNEYEVYHRLKLRGVGRGIATALGFFDDSEDGACALIMLYAGVPLSKESQGKLTISNCKSALTTLESIHCAGILHGDIRLENILISDSGITIIDFGHSRQNDNTRAKAEEMARLRHFLGLVVESDDAR